MKLAQRYILYGQAGFVIGLLVCIIIKPHGLTANGGISYYGVYRETILPYSLMLLIPAYFFIKTAEIFHGRGQQLMRYALTAMGLLTIGILITPDSWSNLMDLLHRICGTSLFVLQLLLSGWFISKLEYDWRAILLTAIELAGGIASFVWLAPPTG